MQIELIEGMIANKLELSGMRNEGGEGQCRSLLYHLFTAVEIFRLMVPQEKETVAEWYQLFAKDFRVNLFLKELKSKKNKEKTAPAPHRKEKNKKEKVQRLYIYADSGDSGVGEDLESRRNAFFRECMSYKGKYDEQMILDFYAYYSMPNKLSNKMRFEDLAYWDTAKLMHIWVNNPISKAKAAADIKLKRTKKTTAQAAENSADAAEREDANARLEQEIAERKQSAVSYEEWLKMKDTHSLIDN